MAFIFLCQNGCNNFFQFFLSVWLQFFLCLHCLLYITFSKLNFFIGRCFLERQVYEYISEFDGIRKSLRACCIECLMFFLFAVVMQKDLNIHFQNFLIQIYQFSSVYKYENNSKQEPERLPSACVVLFANLRILNLQKVG